MDGGCERVNEELAVCVLEDLVDKLLVAELVPVLLTVLVDVPVLVFLTVSVPPEVNELVLVEEPDRVKPGLLELDLDEDEDFEDDLDPVTVFVDVGVGVISRVCGALRVSVDVFVEVFEEVGDCVYKATLLSPLLVSSNPKNKSNTCNIIIDYIDTFRRHHLIHISKVRTLLFAGFLRFRRRCSEAFSIASLVSET